MQFKLILLLWAFSFSGVAQSYYDIANAKTGDLDLSPPQITGLWEVIEVQVGGENLTPIAKWFEFYESGRLVGGNGGITNLRGSFNYDQYNQTLDQLDGGQKDPYGSFKVTLSEDGKSMSWSRFEDGIKVSVSLQRIAEKPLAPWDKITGKWVNEKAEGVDIETKEVKSIYNMELNSYYFGWDGRYRKFDKDDNRIETGIWHIEAHTPRLLLINNAGNTKVDWWIEIKEDSMTWLKEGEKETLTVYFNRIDH